MSHWVNLRKWNFLFKRNLSLQVIRTILSFYRCIRTPARVDLQSIEGACTGNLDLFFEKYGAAFQQAVDSLPRMRIHDEFLSYPLKRLGGDERQHPLYVSMKSGPNGPAMLTMLTDLASLRKHPQTLEAVERAFGYWGYTLPQSSRPVKDKIIGRIVAFSDKGGKTRHIAILDGFTQLALSPVHRYAMETLKKIPQDCTYRQIEGVKDIIRSKCPKYSLDLKNATDRFPIDLQVLVVERLCRDYGYIWSAILTKRPYAVRGIDRQIFYKTGQPMGALSSWPIFALTHHCLVRMVFSTLGIQPSYWILGDDIVIGNKEAADIYKECLTLLGVQISVSKSVYSDDGGSFEFAKRRYHNGLEVTPISCGAISGSSRIHPYLFLGTVYNQLSKLCNTKITLSRLNICLVNSQVKQWMLYVEPFNKVAGCKPRVSYTERQELKVISTLKKVTNPSFEIRRTELIDLSPYGKIKEWDNYMLTRFYEEVSCRLRQLDAHRSRFAAKTRGGGSIKAPTRGFKWSAETNVRVIQDEILPWLLIPDLKVLLDPVKDPRVNREVMVQLRRFATRRAKPLTLLTYLTSLNV